jgi:quinoprotein glucose dehydrogenase
VCLNIKTGKMVWFKQLIRHDIWDYDMPIHPILVDIRVNGRPTKAVVQMGKMALAWVFDRTNGQPVWPIPDVPVTQTDVPTEWTAATQPIPSKPPAFDYVGIKTDDLIDFTRSCAPRRSRRSRPGRIVSAVRSRRHRSSCPV